MAEPHEDVVDVEVAPRRAGGVHPVLLAAFCALLLLLVLDVSGIFSPQAPPIEPPRRVASTARAAHGPIPESNPLPLDAEASPSGEPEPGPSSSASAVSSPSAALRPSPAVRASSSAAPSAVVVAASPTPTVVTDRPQEVEVRVPIEAPAEVEVETAVVGPPPGAHVGGDGGKATLGWPAGTATRWHVEVLAQGHPWFAQDVTVPSVTVKVEPGPTYQWRVTAAGSGEVVPWRTFQYREGAAIDFHGQDGGRGPAGASFGEGGGKGSDGADGQDMDVWVERVDGYVRVRVETVRGLRDTVYVAPSGGVVKVRASGGAGGSGGAGATGQSAVVSTQRGWTVAVGNGGNGGGGGSGGKGGVVRLHAPPDLERYVDVDVRGGPGGEGGPGGPGALSTGTAPPGTEGRAGAAGASGPSGRVERAP